MIKDKIIDKNHSASKFEKKQRTNEYASGVSEVSKITSRIDEVLEELQRNGYAILKNVFSQKNCEIAKKKIDEIYKKQIEECGDESYLKSIDDQNVARALFVYDDFFVKFIDEKDLMEILERSLGEKYILNLQNCPINRVHDKHLGAAWHRDLHYQHFVPSRPLALNTLVVLDKFTKENGGTFILPFSHKFEQFPSINYVEKNAIQIEADIGDVIILDSLTYHRAGANNTNQERRLVVNVFTLPLIKKQYNFPKMLNGKFLDNEKLSYIFGYDSKVEDSVLDRRKKQKERYKKKPKYFFLET